LSLLRFIQKVGVDIAYKQLIKYISEDERLQFSEIMKSYGSFQQEVPFKTRNGDCLPSVIEQCFINGDVDRTLIEVFINREVPVAWQDLSLVHIRLLLPICYILLRWSHQHGDFNPIITHKGQQYYLFKMFKSEDVPLLIDIPNLPKNDRRNYVLYCIRFILQSQATINWNMVNDDYILWLSLLKLWFHEQNNRGSSVKSVLLALIISFLKHVLLDTYDKKGKIEIHLHKHSDRSYEKFS
jgi:hypothetical protein